MRIADPELAARRQQQIADAAVACFIAKGFHQSSMAEIAAAAKVSMGLLYRYFPNKEALVFAVAALDREEQIAAIAALSDLPGQIVPTWRDWLASNLSLNIQPGMVRLMAEIYAEAGRNPALMNHLQQIDQAIAAMIQNKLQRQLPALSKPALERVCAALLVLNDGLALRHVLGQTREDKTWEQLIEHCIEGVFAGVEIAR